MLGMVFEEMTPIFRGFKPLSEADNYMASKGMKFYEYRIKYDAGVTTLKEGNKAYYAIANGRTPGVKEYH